MGEIVINANSASYNTPVMWGRYLSMPTIPPIIGGDIGIPHSRHIIGAIIGVDKYLPHITGIL